jgi:hypothetical protein
MVVAVLMTMFSSPLIKISSPHLCFDLYNLGAVSLLIGCSSQLMGIDKMIA